MQKPFLLTLGFLICLSAIIFAKPVDSNKACEFAKNYWFDKTSRVKSINIDQIEPVLVFSDVMITDTLFRVFNIGNNGFIIISGNDIVLPVLGFSFESKFITDNIPSSLNALLDNYRNQISYAVTTRQEQSDEIITEWELYSGNKFKNITTYDTPELPLIMTKWDQGFPYNELCPEDAAGPGGYALVGCVAISVAQVMKYYNFPSSGTSSHSYNNSGYGYQSANFGITSYQWNNMPNEINASNNALATLLYHVGVASNMHYGTDGSGADLGDAVNGLIDHFRYTASIDYIHRNDYSDLQWSIILKNEIDNARPVIYEGYDSEGGGHAWNCDGYMGNLFHMNWGWGGSANGFFLIDHLSAGGYFFSDYQGMVINIFPEANYPQYCSYTKYITGMEGTIDDGSGTEKCENNITCMWHIQPQCGSIIEISFDYFDLKAGDTVCFYNGPTIYHPLIAKFSEGDSLFTLLSSGNTVLIKFITDGITNSNGWNASYKSLFCSGTKVLTQSEGTINDGSGSCDYKSSTYCKWIIEPQGAVSVTFNFSEFSLASDIDNVRIYSNEALEANQIAKFDALNPPVEVTVPSGVAVMRFFTNSINNGGGWTAHYTAEIDPYGIAENINFLNMSVYPNPANNSITVEMENATGQEGQISLFNLTGCKVHEHQLPVNSFKAREVIDIRNYPAGIYFVRLSAGSYSKTEKLIIE